MTVLINLNGVGVLRLLRLLRLLKLVKAITTYLPLPFFVACENVTEIFGDTGVTGKGRGIELSQQKLRLFYNFKVCVCSG